MIRYLIENISKDLEKKMVFLSGPRQVGKTTLAKTWCTTPSAYLNWDISLHREVILNNEIPDSLRIVFDELHKYKNWRGFLKGVYDEFGNSRQILVTGSARLDLYRYSGDSLQGRYFNWTMLPLSVAELGIKTQPELEQLLVLGGFPEPFFSGSEEFSKRWSSEYRTRVLEDELTSVEQFKDLGKVELLMLRLPELVGSPLSLNSLREDLESSHEAVKRWVDVLERFFALFRILPFGSPQIKAVKKEQKHYHFDWSVVNDPGARFENFVACHLIKWVTYEKQSKGRSLELRFFKDSDKHEVDFIVLEDQKPIWMIECKYSRTSEHSGIKYLKRSLPDTKAFIVFQEAGESRTRDGVVSISALEFLQRLT